MEGSVQLGQQLRKPEFFLLHSGLNLEMEMWPECNAQGALDQKETHNCTHT